MNQSFTGFATETKLVILPLIAGACQRRSQIPGHEL
jgi:hypothetical protein